MSLPTWPEELGRPLLDGLALDRGDNRKFLRGDAGPTRVRGSRFKPERPVSVAFIVTDQQRARFDRFFDEECTYGVLPFVMADPTRDGNGLLDDAGLALCDETGAPLLVAETWLCQFGEGVPSIVPAGRLFRLSFNLVILP